MNDKKIFSRQEKLIYYAAKIAALKIQLKRAEDRLEFISSDKYQNWESDLAKSLAEVSRHDVAMAIKMLEEAEEPLGEEGD